MATPRLVELIDRYRATHGVSDSELARRIGISRENLRKWRVNGISRLPDHDNLAAVARVIGKPYRDVLSAALFDTGYLTDDQAATPRPHEEVLQDAINVLTEATRLTNQPMRQTNSGQWEVDPDPRAALRIDWAAFVTLALAGAAANVGSIEEALGGRPGSWEAEMVRRTMEATVFDDNDLLRHRTDPVVVDLWVESLLDQLGDGSDDAYADAQIELDRRADAVAQPTDLPPGPFTTDDPRIAGVNWVNVDDNGYLNITHAGWTGNADDMALLAELSAEAETHRDATPGEIAYEQAWQSIATLVDALDDLKRSEYTDYATRLTQAIEAKLAALDLTVPLTITITPAPETWAHEDWDKHAPPTYPRNAIEAAIENAIMETPTPATLPGTPLERLEAMTSR